MKTIRLVSEEFPSGTMYYLEERWNWWPIWTFKLDTITFNIVMAEKLFELAVTNKRKVILKKG
jgi:hypothetical protein